MATYAQLQAEPVWLAQFVPPALLGLSKRLRVFFGKGPNEIGSPGDNNHLTGRHRSRNWVLTSRYCTRRSYGTVDSRDLAGNGDWYRAIDIGITGQVLYDACRRLDAAVRAGRLPGVAEWFGSYDGKAVVGWYEGRASSSDSSHLWHLHIGFWTSDANDEALMALIYDIVTGSDMTPELLYGEDTVRYLREPDGSIYAQTGERVGSALVLVHITKPAWDELALSLPPQPWVQLQKPINWAAGAYVRADQVTPPPAAGTDSTVAAQLAELRDQVAALTTALAAGAHATSDVLTVRGG